MDTSIPSAPSDLPHSPTLPPPYPSSPNPPPPNPGTTDDMLLRHAQYARIRYGVCLGLLAVCPILNLYTVGLAAVYVYALDEVIGQNNNRIPWMAPSAVPANLGANYTPTHLNDQKRRTAYAERVRANVGDSEEHGKSISELLKDAVWGAYTERRTSTDDDGTRSGGGVRRFVEEVVFDTDGTGRKAKD
ncbi:hypothetical protein BDZ91DRAFT_713128 [Kalaharituber pfeilii]|nr:hypothetical protein BDZ91DRAFT_713128 [Kalaharituber pfeilii]